MANKVITTNYPKNPKQIMIADSEMISLGVQVTNTGISADSGGKKILKAGTPLYGSLRTRNTAFVKASTSNGASNAVGIILHDVDVTAGAENAAIVIFGVVDLEKLDSTVQALITTEVETALNGKIFFTTGSGNALS